MKPAACFWKAVKKFPNGCWLFSPKARTYYGIFRGKSAHRYSWEMHKGPIPKGMFVLHRCDAPHCIRPDHLFLGTASDNAIDASKKGRLAARRPDGPPQKYLESHCSISEALEILERQGIKRTRQWAKMMIVCGRFRCMKFYRSPIIPKIDIENFITEETKRRSKNERQ